MKRALVAIVTLAAAAAISALVVLLDPETSAEPAPLPPVPPSDRPLAGGPPLSVSLSIAEDRDPVEPGDKVTLKLRLVNQHRIDQLHSPLMQYRLPPGWEFVSSVPDAPYDPRTRVVRF